MNIISIDPGKGNLGIFLKVGKDEKSILIHQKPKTTQAEAMVNIYNTLNDIFCRNSIHCAFMEDYSLNFSYPNSLIKFCEIVGIIKLALKLKNIPCILIHSGTWKSLTGIKIKKREHKKQYLQAIKTKYGKHFESIDNADAYLIYKAAQILSKKTDFLTDEQMRIRKEMKNVIKNHESCS